MSADETDIHDSRQGSRNASEELVGRWLHFRDNYQTLGYRKASYEYFAMWARERFNDLPSRDPEVLRKIVRACQKRMSRRSEASKEA